MDLRRTNPARAGSLPACWLANASKWFTGTSPSRSPMPTSGGCRCSSPACAITTPTTTRASCLCPALQGLGATRQAVVASSLFTRGLRESIRAGLPGTAALLVQLDDLLPLHQYEALLPRTRRHRHRCARTLPGADNRFVLLTVAHLIAAKGIDVVLRASPSYRPMSSCG